MAMQTSLSGRLRNTELPLGSGLLPLFEAVVNSIHAIDARGDDAPPGKLSVQIIREPQIGIAFVEESRRGASPLEPIKSFLITDNGEGFSDVNFISFETLDTEHKVKLGCRGVGRLLWLKAFDAAEIDSTYRNAAGAYEHRIFRFTTSGVDSPRIERCVSNQNTTTVKLDAFKKNYRERAPKNGQKIALALLEHCLWYFVRDGGAPLIEVLDANECYDLNSMFDEYMHTSVRTNRFDVDGNLFEITHLKLKATSKQQPCLAWCAAGRVVKDETISGKVPGLFGRLADSDGEFVYSGYLTSEYLDKHVRSERTEFAIPEDDGEIGFPSLSKIRERALQSTKDFLGEALNTSIQASEDRVNIYVREKAPRYRTVIKHISQEKLAIDPSISDKELDLLLHKQLADLESSLISEGHQILAIRNDESGHEYQTRLSGYLAKVDDIKKSDLADYVFHRKIVLDVLKKAIERQSDGKYSREELIHEFIMPMRQTSDDIRLDQSNLWLLDERLAFHDYLASDKPLATMPITGAIGTKEPDIIVLNVFDEPILVSDKGSLPLASIVVIEIKRPMRNDAAEGEDKDPITQALKYLDRVRKGQVTTPKGRPIPRSEDIPGFCYIVCDITPSVETRCKLANLTVTSDKMGYFGYNDNFKSYIEVISYDRLLRSAEERNRAFFAKLGLPHN